MLMQKKIPPFIQSMQKGFSFSILMYLYIHTTLILSMTTVEYDHSAGIEKQNLTAWTQYESATFICFVHHSPKGTVHTNEVKKYRK